MKIFIYLSEVDDPGLEINTNSDVKISTDDEGCWIEIRDEQQEKIIVKLQQTADAEVLKQKSQH